jgi:hypothetical protein
MGRPLGDAAKRQYTPICLDGNKGHPETGGLCASAERGTAPPAGLAVQADAPCGGEEEGSREFPGSAVEADAASPVFRRRNFHDDGQHELRAAAHRRNRAVAGVFQQGDGFFAQVRVVRGEEREGFQSHGADGDAVLFETGADQGEQPLALGGCLRIVRGGDQDVAAGLPFLYREGGGDFRQQIRIAGKDAWLAAADEAGQFGGAAMLEGIIRAEGADEFADSGTAGFGEERLPGGSRVGGSPGTTSVRGESTLLRG